MCYFLDYVSAIMTKNVDQSILISDMLDFGSAHFSMELMRAAIEVSGTLFTQRMVKVYILNAGYIFWFIYGSVKPFLLQRQRDRI